MARPSTRAWSPRARSDHARPVGLSVASGAAGTLEPCTTPLRQESCCPGGPSPHPRSRRLVRPASCFSLVGLRQATATTGAAAGRRATSGAAPRRPPGSPNSLRPPPRPAEEDVGGAEEAVEAVAEAAEAGRGAVSRRPTGRSVRAAAPSSCSSVSRSSSSSVASWPSGTPRLLLRDRAGRAAQVLPPRSTRLSNRWRPEGSAGRRGRSRRPKPRRSTPRDPREHDARVRLDDVGLRRGGGRRPGPDHR